LVADRASAETTRADQLRLYFSVMALCVDERAAAIGVEDDVSRPRRRYSTIRTELLKTGAQVRVTARKVWVSMASNYPWQPLYRQVWANLPC
jgi:hypothetical protein